MHYSTWIFVDLGVIFRIFKTCPKRSLGTPEKLRVVSPEAHVGRGGFMRGIYVVLGVIFRIFKICPKHSLGSPEKVRVVLPEAHVSFEIGSGFRNFAENQLNPCTIVHGFLSIRVGFSEFSKFVYSGFKNGFL